MLIGLRFDRQTGEIQNGMCPRHQSNGKVKMAAIAATFKIKRKAETIPETIVLMTNKTASLRSVQKTEGLEAVFTVVLAFFLAVILSIP